MGSRSALHEDALPSIEIESFEVERPRPLLRRASNRSPAVNFRPPGSEFIERVRFRYNVTIGVYRGFNPRTQSTVERRLERRAHDVIGALCTDGDVFAYDALEHEYRLPVDLHLAWSWPDLPMWLTVGEVSSTKCALRLSLRSRRRVRYPARYFDAAHSALARLEHILAGITVAAGRSG